MPTWIRASGTADPRRSPGEWRRVWRRLQRNRPALIGLVIVGAIAVLAIVPQAFAPYSPYNVTSSLRGSPPSLAHPLGMDQVGRDVLSRVVYGARIAMLVGLAATGLSLVVGVAVGSTAGYFGGGLDAVLMRLVDALQAFPILVLLIAVAAALGPSLGHVIVILGFTTWAQYARVVRADVLSLREREFALAARMLGVSNARITGWRRAHEQPPC